MKALEETKEELVLKAPDIIRKNMSNFPVVSPDFQLLDFGNITSMKTKI